jgi:CheY-like chemotaxis protein
VNPAATRQTGTRPTILVVDDERDVREALRLSLEIEGYDVCTAMNGLEALDLLAAGLRPSAVLLDLMMPVMNGPDFLHALRCDPRFVDLPVVVLTAFTRIASDVRARGLAAQGFLAKPIDVDDLLATLRARGKEPRESPARPR